MRFFRDDYSTNTLTFSFYFVGNIMSSKLPNNLESALEEIKKLRLEVKRLKEDADDGDVEDKPKHDKKFWKNIREKCKKRQVAFIKKLLQEDKLKVNDQDDKGNTLLHIAAKEGNYEVCALCINLTEANNLENKLNGENDDGYTPQQLAEQDAWFHVEQLLLFASKDAAIGTEVNEYAKKLNSQSGIIDNLIKMLEIKKNKKVVQDTIVDILIQQIKSKQAFSDLLLNLSWRIVTKNNKNPLNNQLWKAIKQTVTEIINTKKERAWYWLKNYLLPSTV